MVILAAKKVMAGSLCHAFVLSRPPGHHNGCNVELDRRMAPHIESDDEPAWRFACHGGCLFNETAIAVRHLVPPPSPDAGEIKKKSARGRIARAEEQQETARQERVLKACVLDLDVHFGDGTAWCFYSDPNVLCISLHMDQIQNGYFPYLKGSPRERGEGAGIGTTLNIPMLKGMGDEQALEMLRAMAWPAVEEFTPDIIFLSLGLDGLKGDPTESGINLTPAFFQKVTAEVLGLCPRIVCTLQGGYLPERISEVSKLVIQTLASHPAEVDGLSKKHDSPKKQKRHHHKKSASSGEWPKRPRTSSQRMDDDGKRHVLRGHDEGRRFTQKDDEQKLIFTAECREHMKEIKRLHSDRSEWWDWQMSFDYGLSTK